MFIYIYTFASICMHTIQYIVPRSSWFKSLCSVMISLIFCFIKPYVREKTFLLLHHDIMEFSSGNEDVL